MDYWHKKWACPFFKWDERLCVGCEGGKLRFADTEHALAYMDAHCANMPGWEQCSVAVSLLQYYDRQGENKP